MLNLSRPGYNNLLPIHLSLAISSTQIQPVTDGSTIQLSVTVDPQVLTIHPVTSDSLVTMQPVTVRSQVSHMHLSIAVSITQPVNVVVSTEQPVADGSIVHISVIVHHPTIPLVTAEAITQAESVSSRKSSLSEPASDR